MRILTLSVIISFIFFPMQRALAVNTIYWYDPDQWVQLHSTTIGGGTRAEGVYIEEPFYWIVDNQPGAYSIAEFYVDNEGTAHEVFYVDITSTLPTVDADDSLDVTAIHGDGLDLFVAYLYTACEEIPPFPPVCNSQPSINKYNKDGVLLDTVFTFSGGTHSYVDLDFDGIFILGIRSSGGLDIIDPLREKLMNLDSTDVNNIVSFAYNDVNFYITRGGASGLGLAIDRDGDNLVAGIATNLVFSGSDFDGENVVLVSR